MHRIYVMGQPISTLCNCVCNQTCSKPSQRVSSLRNKAEVNSSVLSAPLTRCIYHFDIWTPSNHDKNLILVWLDEQMDIDLENTAQMKMFLQRINEQTLLFSSRARFVEFLETLTNESIFLIISGQFSIDLLPFVNSKEQIHALYIFCIQDDHYKSLINDYSKLRRVSNHHVELLLEIQKDISIYKKQAIKFNSLSKSEQNSITDLSPESALFFWSYLLKDILINTDKRDDAKEVMLAYCRLQCESDNTLQAQIDEFEKCYQSNDAIQWYTKDSFVHRLVNQSIKAENINALLHLKFFITDLSTCLKLKWKPDYIQRSHGFVKTYRGAQLTNAEIEKLKPDSLITPNGYLSTSESLETASIYAGNTLFEIDIDPLVENLIFANIAEYSNFPQEQEILSDMGCIFRIVSVVYDELNQRSVVKMIGVNEAEQLASDFIERIKHRKKTNGYFNGLLNDFVDIIGYERGISLYEYFLRLPTVGVQNVINNCSRSIHLYEKCCDASNVAILYGCFGWFFTQRAEYDLAIEYCTRALSLVGSESPNANMVIEIAMIHNTIGWSYYEKGDYDPAISWCQKARKIFKSCPYVEDSKYVKVLRSEQNLKKSPSRNDVEYAEILTNIGCISCKKKEFELALFYCEKSMSILQRCDHETIFDRDREVAAASTNEIDNHHETIAANYEVFADVCFKKENYVLALEYYEKAQVIFETITPRIPICLQRSPAIFGRMKQRLQNSIQIIERLLVATNRKNT
ncbi:unnamed protein product [Didymodactylos carnosus]|uniref:ADP ribosyltransferase domain-containing protein n=1 Tax=Didymodactylos carnosus TaxID=1234261 RepID=A0A814XBG0_9BILA|nr:unnamed protein product [Didymodactylos carnosus]CAF1215593.1 unnamed protein product [Didymodactylos carnosus]CAF3791142.1 unnamed protein product [Didymodactylos carnosus]CAF3979424.1 unnamed protein product [Didymodactylos carnosus]